MTREQTAKQITEGVASLIARWNGEDLTNTEWDMVRDIVLERLPVPEPGERHARCPSRNHVCEHDPVKAVHCTECHADWAKRRPLTTKQ